MGFGTEFGVPSNRLQLGGKEERGARTFSATVVERLLTDAVANEDELSFTSIPEREGKHARRALECPANAPRLDSSKQGLGIRVPLPIATAPSRKLVANLAMVVDFAVVDDHVAIAVRTHRLIAGRRNVDDRKSIVRESDAIFAV